MLHFARQILVFWSVEDFLVSLVAVHVLGLAVVFLPKDGFFCIPAVNGRRWDWGFLRALLYGHFASTLVAGGCNTRFLSFRKGNRPSRYSTGRPPYRPRGSSGAVFGLNLDPPPLECTVEVI